MIKLKPFNICLSLTFITILLTGINIGAYGGITQGSVPLSDAGNIADINNDGVVAFSDLMLFIEKWTLDEDLSAADFNRDGRVDIIDFGILSKNWLLDESLIGFWKFDDPNGTTALDSSGNNNTGILVNSPVWTEGKFSGALRFNGDDTAVEIPTQGMNADSGTVCLWAYAGNFSNVKHFLFGLATQPWSNRIQLYISSTGWLRLGLGDNHSLNNAVKKLITHRWYHIALVWDHSDYKVFVNGTLQANGGYTGLTELEEYADIGNNGNRLTRIESFDGIIDEVRIYNRPLSTDEISDLYPVSHDTLIDDALWFSADQLAVTANSVGTTSYPRYTNSYASWNSSSSRSWTSGFFPGCLWFMYEFTGDPAYRDWAQDWTAGLESQAYNSTFHDVGFIINTSFGNGYRLTNEAAYRDVLLAAAQTLSKLYNPTINAINLGWGSWQCPIAIDTMMNIELLFWASRNGGLSEWRDMAANHAYTTINDLVREDGGTFHLADYNATTGELVRRFTLQGYDDNSTWSRGQAWALYGFTVCYRETQDPNFLAAAQLVAEYFIDNLPADSVAYWDFDAPNIPNAERDSSAASIAASGLLELSTLAHQDSLKQKYFTTAHQILLSLALSNSLDGYLAVDTNGDALSPGILMHGCYYHTLAGGSVYDDSLIWGDYYFLEALLRYNNISNILAK